MLRNVFSYLILTNQIDIAEPKIYHHFVFLQEFGSLLGECLIHKIHLTFIMLVPVCRQSFASWH